MKVGETIVFNTKIAAFTFLFSTMFDLIKEMINESDEVWRWSHWKYGMSQIVQNLHSIKKKSFTLLLRMIFDGNNKTIN